MNVGVISSRYARALLKFAESHGEAPLVCSQAKVLEKALVGLPEFRKLLSDKAGASASLKAELLDSALGEEKMAPSLKTFLDLVQRNGRTDCLHLILHNFTDLYNQSRGIHVASLTTAVPVPGSVREKVAGVLAERLGGEIQLEASAEPELIGGAIVTVDGYRIDTSVRRQLEKLRKEFTLMNKRIV